MHPIKLVVQEIDIVFGNGQAMICRCSLFTIYTIVFLLANGSSPFFHVDLLGDTVSITFVRNSLLQVSPMFPFAPQDGWGMLGGADVGSGALLLDCDGTLAETERDGHRVAFNKAFQAWWWTVI